MKSEDIARYVAGLEEEVERLRGGPQLRLSAYGDTPLSYIRELEDKVAEVQRERNAAQAQIVVLDNQRARAESEVRRLTALVKELSQQRDHWEGRAAVAEPLVERLRAAQPTLPDVGLVVPNEYGLLTCGPEPDWYCQITSPDRLRLFAARYLAVADHLDAEAAAADTTPDTSRVTFGTRHEGTGMVLLQHADMPTNRWGQVSREGYAWHRAAASSGFSEYRAAHAGLAEVRKALNTAEAAGVRVYPLGGPVCAGYPRGEDAADAKPDDRARRYLSREVQALVDQGLRGDDLNARVPYEVRDHRALVEAADTTPDDEVAAAQRYLTDECYVLEDDTVRGILRAARTSEDGAA